MLQRAADTVVWLGALALSALNRGCLSRRGRSRPKRTSADSPLSLDLKRSRSAGSEDSSSRDITALPRQPHATASGSPLESLDTASTTLLRSSLVIRGTSPAPDGSRSPRKGADVRTPFWCDPACSTGRRTTRHFSPQSHSHSRQSARSSWSFSEDEFRDFIFASSPVSGLSVPLHAGSSNRDAPAVKQDVETSATPSLFRTTADKALDYAETGSSSEESSGVMKSGASTMAGVSNTAIGAADSAALFQAVSAKAKTAALVIAAGRVPESASGSFERERVCITPETVTNGDGCSLNVSDAEAKFTASTPAPTPALSKIAASVQADAVIGPPTSALPVKQRSALWSADQGRLTVGLGGSPRTTSQLSKPALFAACVRADVQRCGPSRPVSPAQIRRQQLLNQMKRRGWITASPSLCVARSPRPAVHAASNPLVLLHRTPKQRK